MAQVDVLTDPDPEKGWSKGKEQRREVRSNRQIIREEMMEGRESSGGCFKCCLVFTTTLFIVVFFPLVVIKCILVVQEYERAIIFKFGRVKKAKVVNPGIYFVNPCLETVVKVDLRTELQKRADRADQSVLFFLASANFWEKHAKNCAIMSILDYFWSILDLLFGANFLWGKLVGANLYAFCNYAAEITFSGFLAPHVHE